LGKFLTKNAYLPTYPYIPNDKYRYRHKGIHVQFVFSIFFLSYRGVLRRKPLGSLGTLIFKGKVPNLTVGGTVGVGGNRGGIYFLCTCSKNTVGEAA
jgi:hypothetical protein